MASDENEEKLLRSVALQNAQSILLARQQAEQALIQAKAALELRTEELAHSLAMMRATLESTTDGILVTDDGGKVTGFNGNFVEMWRAPSETMDSREHRQLLEVWGRQFEDPDQFRLRVEEIYASSPPESYDLLELVDGRVVERFSKIQRVDERNVGRVWSFRDITERRRAEEALQKQSEWLRVTLASIGDAVVTTDTEGRVTYLNAVAEFLTGWSNDEAAGQPLETVFRIINEQTRQPVENPAGRALKEGVIVGLANHSVLIRKNGTERPIDDSAAPIKDEQGHVAGVVLIFRDVTEKRRAEEALRVSEERLRFALDSGQLGQWDLDLTDQTATRTLRHDQIFGYETPLAEWTYEMFLEHVHPDDRPNVDQKFRRAVAAGSDWEFEARIYRGDHSLRWIWARGRHFHDQGGKPARMLGVVRDITDQKRAEEALKEADRRKDEFLAMLAHELRNPLAPIRNAAEILRLKGPAAPELQWAREVIDRQVQQMTRLVDDLLDVSRITRGKIELRRERVELVAVVKSAVEASRPLIEKWGHDLTVTIPPEPIHLEADLIRLSQVLLNLLNNAAKYTDQGGRIWLTAERQGDQVLIRVKDTGIGISAEMLPRIFEMFTQVDRTLERSQGGLGIGLMLVQRLVEMHGGTVEAHSTGPGKGSEFVLRFPVAAEVKRKPQEEAGHGQDTVPSTCRILVVDDNEDSAESIAILLRTMGNEVHTANDGLEAVGAAAAFQPDVVLLDIGLPKLNGFDAARRIREQSGGSDIVLIALTGWGQEEDRRRSKEAGFDHHLTKPVDFSLLQKLLAPATLNHPERRPAK